MSSIRNASTRHPIAFALLATLGVLLLYVVAGIVARVTSTGDVSYQVVESLARLGAAAFVFFVIRRLDLLRDSGVACLGAGWIWLIALAAALYRTLAHAYGFFGEFGLGFEASPLSWAVALNGSAAALLEEVTFRGAILAAVLLCWWKLPAGVLRAVWLTSLVFGASHVIRIVMGQPAPVVGMLVLDSTLAGVFYAALVVRGRSVWPAVLVHLAINAYIGARAVSVPEFAETVAGWTVILLSGLPLLVLGLWMLRGGRQTAGV